MHYDSELFATSNWLAVLLGQEIWPERYDPLTDQQDFAELRRHLDAAREAICSMAEATPRHADYLKSRELIDA